MGTWYLETVVPAGATEQAICREMARLTGHEYNYERHCSYSEQVSKMDVIFMRTSVCSEDEARELAQKTNDYYWREQIWAYPIFQSKPSKKIEDLKRRISETQVKYHKYLEDHQLRNQKSAFFGCSKCGSKIARVYYESRAHLHNCPVCGANMLSMTSQNTLTGYQDKIKELEKQIRDEERRLSEGRKATHYYCVCGVHV